MSDPLTEREAQRQTLLLRIEENRSALGRTLLQLRRPVLALDRWQRGVRALLPLLPGLLLAIVATWLALLALRRRDVRSVAVVGTRQPSRNWLAAVQQLMVAWRIALQLQTLLRASMALTVPRTSIATTVATPNPSPYPTSSDHAPSPVH